MEKFKAWIHAFRLRTLPLSFSCIISGAALASINGDFDGAIFTLALLTTLFLQILSNLANDYGDHVSGVDNEQRIGPQRAVQSGVIKAKEMKTALFVFSGLSLISGVILVLQAFSKEQLLLVALFVFFGIASVWAAIKYTVGKNPYGYSGFGDLFVFLFFGLLGVAGSYYLFSQSLNWQVWLLGVAMGFLSTGVLNVNNMRDIDNDKQSGKHSIPVRLGLRKAKVYQYFLVISGLLSVLTLVVFYHLWWILLSYPLFIFHLVSVAEKDSSQLDSELKKLSLSTFFLSFLLMLEVWLF